MDGIIWNHMEMGMGREGQKAEGYEAEASNENKWILPCEHPDR